MGADNVTMQSPSIGAGNTELSRRILESDDILQNLLMRLQGKYIVINDKGQPEYKVLEERKFKGQCQAWVIGKVEEIFNKNVALANYSEKEMESEAKAMCDDFVIGAWLYWRKFFDKEIGVEQYYEICAMYRNFVVPGLRMPLNQGIRKLLSETSSEARQSITQSITEEQTKKGKFFGLG